MYLLALIMTINTEVTAIRAFPELLSKEQCEFLGEMTAINVMQSKPSNVDGSLDWYCFNIPSGEKPNV